MEVSFRNVTKVYGHTTAVKNLNLSIKQGALHFVLGPSGCGKTTTLRMLAGLEKVSSGQIFFDDLDVTQLSSAERGLGMVFQNYALWPHMTVQQNIEYGLKIRKYSKVDMKARLDDVLSMTRLTPFVKRYPGQLSGGQQQRVALARALAIRPKVLLLDEPLSNLDAKLRHEMRENITRIHEETRITTVYVTHDQKEALSMGSDITVMQSGLQLQTGSPRELYQNPRSPFLASFIGDTNLLEGVFLGKDGDQHIVETSFGKLRCRKFFGDFKINDAVVLSIRPETIQVDYLDKGLKDCNEFSAELSHLTYLGETEQLNLDINKTVRLRASLFNNRNFVFKVGQPLKCTINAHDVCVLHPDQYLGHST